MRTVAVIVGILLVLAAAAVAGKALGSGQPFEPFLPCGLAAFGFGIFGLALIVPVPSAQAQQCAVDSSNDSDGDSEMDDE